jgi:hypothetical protein
MTQQWKSASHLTEMYKKYVCLEKAKAAVVLYDVSPHQTKYMGIN